MKNAELVKLREKFEEMEGLMLEIKHLMMSDDIIAHREKCQRCEGTGRVYGDYSVATCSKCNGDGSQLRVVKNPR